MAYDPEQHAFHPHTGFMVDKETGALAGIEHKPISKPNSPDLEYPKWVTPHESHIVRSKRGDQEHVSTPRFVDPHINRDTKEVTVLVHSVEEEEMALAPYSRIAREMIHV
jgi:hypothetical protein